MKHHITYCILMTLLIFSCHSKTEVVEKYENGNIKIKYNLVAGKKNGEYLEYYKNGSLKKKN